MRLYVAVTDNDWFGLHAAKAEIEEVNFWRPSQVPFRALQPGEILLFKLHAPENYIAGGGFFTRYLQLPLNLAWSTFGEANGVRSLVEMRKQVSQYRNTPFQPNDNPTIGCILLAEPFFWDRSWWIPSPADFKLNIPGRGYESETGTGRELWDAVSERLRSSPAYQLEERTATIAAIESQGFGKPQIVLPRLGQGLFRVMLIDAYSHRCSMTGERTLPVLQAAHIKPYPLVQRHELSNGLLLRSDLHTLFDQGYVTVDPHDHKIVVSKRIKEEFENGKEYYKLEGQPLRDPSYEWAKPLAENLEFHSQHVFR